MTILASAPIPGDNHRNLADEPTIDLPVQRGPLGNREQLDDRPGVIRRTEALRRKRFNCPVWCADRHVNHEPLEEQDWTIGYTHERQIDEVMANDAAWLDRPATAFVFVEAADNAEGKQDPARLVVTIAEGTESAYHGTEGTQAWTGTPEQARRFAAAILAAADVIDQAGA